MRYVSHGNDVRLCFQYIWENSTMGMWSGGCVFCPYEVFFPWIWCKAVFSVHLGKFYHGNVVRGLCFLSIWGLFSMDMIYDCVFSTFGPILPWECGQGAVFSVHMGSFFPWIWYKTVFSGNLGQFYHGNDFRGLGFLAIWANFTMVMMSGGCVFCGGFFSWIWYKTVFSGNLGQFCFSNDVRGLCFLSPRGIFSMDMI